VNSLLLVVDWDGGGNDLLVRVDDRVHNRWEGWEVDGQGDGGNGVDARAESFEELALLNVQNIRCESLTLVVDLSNAHTVREGRDVQHVEKGGLRWTDTGTSLTDLDVGGDFNGTTGNLGWDTKSLEERGLSWFHTSVSSWNVDIARSDGTSTGWSSDTVGENLLTSGLEVGVGENETDVAL